MAIEELNNILKTKEPPHFMLLFGEETFLRDFYMEQISDIIIPDREDYMNRVAINGATTWDKLREACEKMPFFSDKVLVTARNTGLFKLSKKAGAGAEENPNGGANETASGTASGTANGTANESSDGSTGMGFGSAAAAKSAAGKGKKAEGLWAFLENIPDYVYLLISEDSVDRRSKVYKTAQKYAFMAELNSLDETELMKWIARQFARRGYGIERTAVERMVEVCDSSMYTLQSEIEKLCSYRAAERNISRQDIDKICTVSIKSVVFELTDALAQGNCGAAYRVLNDMKQLREAEQKLFVMMANQFSKMYRLRQLLDRGMKEAEAQKLMGMHPFAFKKMLPACRKMPTARLKSIVLYCTETDEKVKTGMMNIGTAIDILISKAGRGA